MSGAITSPTAHPITPASNADLSYTLTICQRRTMTEAFPADCTTNTSRSTPRVHPASPASVQPSQGRYARVAAKQNHAALHPPRPDEIAARASILPILHFSRMTPAPTGIAKFDLIKGTAIIGIPQVNITAFHPLRRSHEMLRERLYFLYFTLPA
jgi:hypothetical protein